MRCNVYKTGFSQKMQARVCSTQKTLVCEVQLSEIINVLQGNIRQVTFIMRADDTKEYDVWRFAWERTQRNIRLEVCSDLVENSQDKKSVLTKSKYTVSSPKYKAVPLNVKLPGVLEDLPKYKAPVPSTTTVV